MVTVASERLKLNLLWVAVVMAAICITLQDCRMDRLEKRVVGLEASVDAGNEKE